MAGPILIRDRESDSESCEPSPAFIVLVVAVTAVIAVLAVKYPNLFHFFLT